MEEYLSSSLGEPEAEVPTHRTISSPGGKETCLEKLPKCFANVGLLRIKQPSGFDRKEGAIRPTNNNQLVLNYEGNEADTSVSISKGGSPRTHDRAPFKGRTNRGPTKGDMMELDIAGEDTASP